MLPQSRRRERAHRERKRQREMASIIDAIRPRLDDTRDAAHRRVLEFGCGDGFQIPFLRALGDVVASDVTIAPGLRSFTDVALVRCDLEAAPFAAETFDVIFSNHVMEHVEDPAAAMREMQRIGTPSCVYAISVPTNVWLLLSVPGGYWQKARGLADRLWPAAAGNRAHRNDDDDARTARRSRIRRIAEKLMPMGHGTELDFVRCYRRFRVESWQALFIANGFVVEETVPLLLYGASEWPVIPTMAPIGDIASSVLFILRKK